jgi:hypothetical protein
LDLALEAFFGLRGEISSSTKEISANSELSPRRRSASYKTRE